jgi:Family of unknown function (DUF6221)
MAVVFWDNADVAVGMSDAEADHIVRHDPARGLADVAAMRRQIARDEEVDALLGGVCPPGPIRNGLSVDEARDPSPSRSFP